MHHFVALDRKSMKGICTKSASIAVNGFSFDMDPLNLMSCDMFTDVWVSIHNHNIKPY